MRGLNEYECGMLDAILEAFGISDRLTIGQLLNLFDQDEDTALAMVQILKREELIAETGSKDAHKLPQFLELKPKGENYLKEGGFTRRHQIDHEISTATNSPLANLQHQNMLLQNERLEAKNELARLKDTISNFRIREYIYWVLLGLILVVGYILGNHRLNH